MACASLLTVALLFPVSLRADTFTWTGGNTAANPVSGLFSATVDWLGGAVPPGTAPDTLAFGGSGAFGYSAINDLSTLPLVLNGLSLSSTATAANFLSGGQLRFSGTVPTITQGTGATGQFVINNAIDLQATLSLAGAGTGVVVLGGTISGTGGLTKSGAGTYSLRGVNSFSGDTAISAGTLIVAGDVLAGANGALGNSSSAVAMTGGSLLFAGQATMGRGLTVGASSSLGNNTVGNVTFSGNAAISAGTLTLNSVTGGTLTQTGVISGAGAVTIGATGLSGSVRLNGNNTYAGITTLSLGRLAVGADTNFTGTSSSPTISSGPLGTGSLSLPTGTTIQAADAPRLVVNALADLTSTAAYTLTFGGAENLTLSRNWILNTTTTAVTRTFSVLTNPGLMSLSGNLTQSSTGAVTLGKSGLGTLVLSGTNSFTGGVSVSGGTLAINGDAALGAVPGSFSAANITLTGGTLRATADTSLAANRGVTLATPGGTLSASPNQSLSVAGAIAGAFTLNISGGGTVSLNGATNAATSVIVGGGTTLGTTRTSGQTLVGSTTGTLTLNGGTLAVPVGATTLAVPRFQYGGGSYLTLGAGGVFTAGEAAATALTRNNVGTLVLMPSSTLGTTAKFLITNAAAQPGSTAGMLTVPSIVVRDGSGDVDFVTYAGAAGFTAKTSTVVTDVTLAASASTSVWEAAAGTNNTADSVLDILAVRTAGDIAPAGVDSLLLINSGGLLINGTGAAPQISTNLFFGSAGAQKEALVYVKGGYSSGIATLSGNLTATNFTKFGPGTLLISGTNNSLAPTATGLRTLTVQQGSIQFGSAGSVPLATMVLNDTATLDTAGLNLTVAGLGGNGFVGNSGTLGVSTLTVNSMNQTTTYTGTLQNVLGAGTGTLALVKSGTGTLVLGGRSSYSGGTTINAGQIISGAGVFSALGTLQASDPLGLGTGPVTLAGGTLDLRYDGTGIMDVVKGLNIATFGPGAGYNVTVAAQNNFGQSNVTSTINTAATTGSGLTLSLNALTLNSPILNVTGANTFNLRFGGTTTLTSDTTFNVLSGGTLVLDGTIAGGTFNVAKLGAGTLILSNTATGSLQNALGATTVVAGTLDARFIDNGSSPLGTASPVIVAGGSLVVRHDGDGTTAPELISLGLGVVVNGATPSATLPTMTGTATLTVGDLTAAATNKTVAFDSLTISSLLGAPTFTVAGSPASYSAQFGATSFTRDAALNYTANVVHQGAISGYGTLFRTATSASNLYINAANTYTGGTILGGGNTYFGSYVGTLYTPNTLQGTTARLGTGNIMVLPGASLQFNEAANRNGAQTVDVRSNLASFGVLRLAGNITPEQAGLRSTASGWSVDPVSGTATPIATGLLAINSPNYTQGIDLSLIGDGTWFLGSTQDGLGQNGVYNAATLGVGVGNIYRLGGGAAGITGAVAAASLSVAQANVLTGSAALQVGSPLSPSTLAALAQPAIGNVVFAQAQNYIGATTVNRGSTLEIRGAITTSGLDLYGTLIIGGAGGTLANTTGTITMRPGALLRFDNTLGGAALNRWRNPLGTPLDLTLNAATLSLIGNSTAPTTLTIGALTISGGSNVALQRITTSQNTTLTVASLTRALGQTLTITPTAARLGVDERFVATAAPTLTNGMVDPWVVNAADNSFVTYGGGTFMGYNNVPVASYTTQAVATLASTIGTGTQIYDVTGFVTLNAGVNIDAWALRISGGTGIAKAGAAPFSGTQTVLLGSGGLITAGVGTTQYLATVNLSFAQGKTSGLREGLIFNSGTTGGLIVGDFTSGTGGQITADLLTKFGTGTLQLDALQSTFAGNIYVNGGTLTLRNNIAAGSGGGTQAGTGNSILLNYTGAVLNLRGDVVTTFPNTAVLSQGVLSSTIGFAAASTGTTLTLNLANLSFQGAPQGQMLNLIGANTYSLQVNGATTLSGSSILNLTTASTVTLAGQVTGSGTLVRMGIGTIVLSNLATGTSQNNFTGGTQLYGGTLTAQAKGTNSIVWDGGTASTNALNNTRMTLTSNTLGTGAVTLFGGTLSLLADGSAVTALSETLPLGNNVVMAGNATISVGQLTASGGTYNRLELGNFTIGSQVLTTTATNNYSLQVTGLTIRGNPTLNVSSAPLVVSGPITDNGGSASAAALGVPAGTAFAITKSGAADLYFDTPAASVGMSNGIIINSGVLRTGKSINTTGATSLVGTVYPNLTAGYGSGLIRVNSSGGVRIDTPATLAPGQQIYASSSATSVATVRLNNSAASTISMAFLQNILTPDSTTGTLAIEGSGATPSVINMALIGDGTWFFSGSTVSTSYSGLLLPGAPATPGGVPAYRWTAAFIQTTVGTVNMFSGNTRLISGGYAAGQVAVSTSSIYNASNSFTGGTDMMRGTGTGQVLGATVTGAPAGTAIGTGNPVWGTGDIDVFGSWTMFQLATVGTVDGQTNLNVINFHPGSRLTWTPDTSVVNTNRWGDTAPLALNGSQVSLQTSIIPTAGTGIAFPSETIGAVSFERGSSLRLLVGLLNASSAGSTLISSTGPLTRVNSGTLSIISEFTAASAPFLGLTNTGYNNLGTTAANFQRFMLPNEASLPAPLAGTVSSGTGAPTGMAPAYIVNATDLTFVSYNATTGFQNVLANITSPAAGQVAYSNVVSTAVFPSGLTGGSATVDVEANTALADNPSIFALRVNGVTVSNGVGQLNTISIASDAANNRYGGLLLAGTATINTNLTFGGGTEEALIFTGGVTAATGAAASSTATINGDISAGVITKFGLGILVINKDQTNYAGGWNINEGTLQANTIGALGKVATSNTVTLNGPTSLNLTAASGNALNAVYTSGAINAVDASIINFRPGADDRTATISDLNIQNTAPGDSAGDAQITISLNTNRTILNAGILSLQALQSNGNSDAVLNVAASSTLATGSAGIGSGFYIAGLSNQSSNTTRATALRKWGNGTLYVDGDNSTSWQGTVRIEQGAVQALNKNALGGEFSSLIQVLKNGVLDIGVAGFSRTNGITYAAGSGERWSVDNARIGPNAPSVLNIGAATLQIGADQLNSVPGTLTVQLNGGSIEGFLRTDDVLPAVYRTVGAGIGFELLGNSFLGQNVLQGLNGVDNGKSPTMQTPFANTATGAILELKGPIIGVGSLTKISLDTVVLSGQSTFSGGLNITAGVVRLSGADDRLSVTGRLLTASGGVFDLGGVSQRVGLLASAHGTISGAPIDGGFVVNSGTTLSNLSVGTSAAVTYSYGGIIQGNVALTKIGGANNVLQLLGANTYVGGTFLNGGVVSITSETALGLAGNRVTFNGGTLRFSAATNLTRPLTLSAGGGTLDVVAGDTATVTSVIDGPGVLTIQNAGTVQLAAANLYAGGTNVNGGSLIVDLLAGNGLGLGPIVLAGGALQFNGGATPSGAILGALSTAGAGQLIVNGSAATTTATFANLARSGSGTIVITPQSASFSTNEVINITTTPTMTGGILGPWAVIQASGADSSGDFMQVIGNTLTTAVYTASGSLDTASSGDVFNANAASTLTAARTVFALKTNQTIGGAFKLSLGDGAGQAGLILNGGGIATSALALGGAEGVVYVGNAAATISAAISGSAGLTKFGSQTLILAGNNSYTGTTTVNGGALSISRDAQLGAGGGVVLNGGTLNITGNTSSTRGFILGVAGGTFQVAGNKSVMLTGTISGAGSLTKTDTGTLVVAAANNYSGNTTVADGKLSIAADDGLGDPNALLTLAGGTLQTTATFSMPRAATLGAGGGGFDVAASTTFTLTGLLTGSGGLTKTGSGELILAGQNQYAGPTTLNGGTLTLAAAGLYSGLTTINYGTLAGTAVGPSQSPFGTSSGLALNNGTLQLNGTTTQTLTGFSGPLTVGGGGSLAINTSASGRTALTFASLARSGNGTLVIIPQFGNLNNTAQSPTGGEFVGFTAPPTVTNTIIAPWAVKQTSSSDSTGDYLALTGTFTQNAVYSTLTDLNSSTNTTVYNAAFLTTNAITAARAVYALRVSQGVTVSGAFTLTVGGTSGQAGIILNGGIISTTTLAFGTQEAVVYAGGFQASAITSNLTGSAGFTKFGDQRLVLSGTNSITSFMSLNGGMLSVAADTNLGGTSAQLRFNGGTLQTTAGFTMPASRTVLLNAGFGTVSVTGANNLTVAGPVSGVGGLIKADTGTLTLTNVTNSYSGDTTVAGGKLVVASGSSLTGGGSVTVGSNATLNVNGSVAGPVSVGSNGLLSGTGSIGGLTLQTGATVSPGNSVGALQVSDAANVWNGGSSIFFEFRNADTAPGTAGTQGTPGTDWDYLNLTTGSLAINATSASPISIRIDSWLVDNSGHGAAANFDPFQSYSWLFLHAGGGISYASGSDVFAVDASTFGAGVFGAGNPYDSLAAGTFFVSGTTNDLYLNYSSVPEPSSLFLVGAASLIAGRHRRRRKNCDAISTNASVRV